MTDNYFLVRIGVRRWVDSTTITTVSNVYNFSIHTKPLKVFGSGTEYTFVADDTTPSSGEWSYVDGKVYMYEASATDEVSIVWPLHVTHTINRYTNSDPTDAGTDVVEFQARMVNTPSVRYTTSDQFYGVVSSDSITLVLAGESGWVESILTNRDQFTEQAVNVWRVSGGTALSLFSGRITDYGFSLDNAITLDVASSFDAFTKEALMGDRSDEAYLTNEHPDVTKLDEGASGTPITYCLSSATLFESYEYNAKAFSAGGAATYYAIADKNFLKGQCLDYSESSAVNSCRDWSVFRKYTSDDFATYSVGTVDSVEAPNFGVGVKAAALYLNYADLSDFGAAFGSLFLGATVKVTYSTTDYYGFVREFDAANLRIVLDFDIAYNSSPWGTSGGTITATVSTSGFKALVCTVRQQQKVWVLKQGRDYAINETSLSSSDHVYITLVNNCEGNFADTGNGSPEAITPDVHKVKFGFKLSSTISHQTALQRLIETSGLTVYSSDFSSPTASGNAALFIPRPDNSTLPTYSDALNDILRPLLGQIYLRSNGDIGYKTANMDDLPAASGDTKLDDSDIVGNPEIVSDSTYVITDITFNNEYAFTDGRQYQKVTESNESKQYGSIGKSRYLQHGLDGVPSTEQSRFKETFQRPLKFLSFSSPRILSLAENVDFSDVTYLALSNYRARIVDVQYDIDVSSYRAILLKEVT